MVIVKVRGFTKAQRRWILERDGHQCSFKTFLEGKGWVRCPNRTRLQVHHITPRGYYAFHLLGCGWDVNSPENGVTLCAFHHIGEGAQNKDKPYVIHWDVRLARRNYRGKGPNNSFEKMKVRRMELNQKYGRPYWNTRWDGLFRLVATERNKRFRKSYPGPTNPPYMKTPPEGMLFNVD